LKKSYRPINNNDFLFKMQIFEHHVIFDEVTYDREELKNWYSEVKQYRNDFGTVMNRLREESDSPLSHNKRFQLGLFDTIDSKGFINKHVIDFEPIQKLVKKFAFDTPLQTQDVDVLIYKPGYIFHPHVDFHMHCGIMFPILPDEGAAPIDFYRMPAEANWERAAGYGRLIKSDRDLIYSYYYSLNHPSMFNGDTIHGVKNNDKERVFLRFKCLNMTFQDVIEKTKNGNFLK
jgi:hypothetical protein